MYSGGKVRLMGQPVGSGHKRHKRLIVMGREPYEHMAKVPEAHILVVGDDPKARA